MKRFTKRSLKRYYIFPSVAKKGQIDKHRAKNQKWWSLRNGKK